MEKLKGTPLKALYALLMGLFTVWSFQILPAKDFSNPQLARIFVWHFPCPMIATSLLLLNAFFAVRYLQTGERHWDERALAAIELSYIFSLLTMATGMLFSKMQWGAWWQWDPRQTSFLLVLLIYAAYFAMRSAFPDGEKRASNASAFALAALIPALFLIFVFPRLPQVQSFHPSDSIMKGKIVGDYGRVVTGVMILLAILTGWLYRLRVSVGLMELESEKDHERLGSHSGDSSASGVVRRISLPQ